MGDQIITCFCSRVVRQRAFNSYNVGSNPTGSTKFMNQQQILYDEIFKKFKNGESLKEYSINVIFKALKSNGLQIVVVEDQNGNQLMFNYVPLMNNFFRILI